MARNKTGNFGMDEELFDKFKRTQEVQQVQEVQNHRPALSSGAMELGTTQGKKGYKLKRINMAFSDANHAYILAESRRRGISATAFVNQLLDAYRAQEVQEDCT